MQQQRSRKIFILVLFLALIIGGVWYGGSQLFTSSSGKLKTVTIGYQAADEVDVSRLRGQLVKKMKKQGYKITFKEFQNGSPEMQALASGKIDYARVGDTPPVSALASGTKLTYIAEGGTKASGSGVLVKKGSGINSVADLKGKTIAYTVGTSSQYMVLKTLKLAGLKTSDVKLENMDSAAAAVAFAKGKVDAWAIWDPYVAKAELTENAKLLVNGKENKAFNRSYIVSPTSYAKKNTKVSKLLIKYMEEDMKWANKNTPTLTKKMAKELKMSKSVIKKALDRRTFKISTLNSEAIKEEQDISNQFYEYKWIKTKVQIKNHVANLK